MGGGGLKIIFDRIWKKSVPVIRILGKTQRPVAEEAQLFVNAMWDFVRSATYSSLFPLNMTYAWLTLHGQRSL